MPTSENNENRDGSLPEGCRELYDVVKRESTEVTPSVPEPKLTGLVFLPEKVSVRYLMEKTGASDYTMTLLMRELNIAGEISRSIEFEDAARILRTYGILAKKGRAA
jgi:hypothetical protein